MTYSIGEVNGMRDAYLKVAETQGFEPWIQVLPGCTLSRGVPSTTRPRLQLVSTGAELRRARITARGF